MQAETVLDRYALDGESYRQWALPARLREISALAMTSDHRLLGVDDERAIVYEIDYRQGRLIKAFALGDPVLRGDFEGLAVLDDEVVLMRSDGRLFVFSEGADGERVSYRAVDTGLESECEFEGLAAHTRDRVLLLLCKDVRRKAEVGKLAIFHWDLERSRVADIVGLPLRKIARAIDEKGLHPSGLVVEPGSGHLLLVAARERALIELQPGGRFVAARALASGRRHPQSEGIELGPDGELMLADEGGDGRALITVYPVATN